MIKKRHLIALTTLLTLAVPSTASAAGGYTVKWGDTLTWIAQDHHVSIDRLASANGLDPNGILVEGTVLRIPGRAAHTRGRGHGKTSSYTVRWGDTLSGIAARYGTTIDSLAAMNGLNPSGILLAGITIRVPAGGSSAWSSGGWSVQSSIDHWSAHYGVDVHLVRAIAWMESGYNQGAVSHAGARGVMQIMPATWRYVQNVLIGARVPHDSHGNVRIGVAYLHHLLNVYGGRVRPAVAAYYQGPGALAAHGVLPETALYVADVLALRSRL
jgi:LysM repeat protein